jgi:thioredoxin-dependent peroxiredoxin
VFHSQDLIPTYHAMLRIGSQAPDITLYDQNGSPFQLSNTWMKGDLVLFFYPKADTPVCTREACAFRDAYAELRALNATVIGISRDKSDAQLAFAKRWNLPFTLLADPNGKAYAAYKVDRLFGLIPGRVTYVIRQGGWITNAYSGLLQSEAHVQQALDALATQGNV